MSGRTQREAHANYLIPGFFGFSNLARFRDFAHVESCPRARVEFVSDGVLDFLLA
jgi:hypothetical protein